MIYAFVIGIATGFNFIILLWKFNKGRFMDGIVDLFIFFIIAILFNGTITGLSVGMVGSALVSLYLLFTPIRIKI